ncbi:MAG TPA: shikimate dehydrogenase [Paenalcaligenes hominis]|uniref:Shikimate dehydrogenase (NADP(+)) n=1 Tax=Paenalcaligenes hominis TaxID=643674 RepID=A0A9D2VHG4_9BURK|nr:shikimate dehydrogenase [Paenalcaligenes hominis]
MTSNTLIRCAVVGNPIAHSRSPEIHQAFAKQCDLALHYDRILADPNDFSDHVRGFFAQGGKGLNITVPFKELAFSMAQVRSPRAELAGAVNTLWMDNHVLHGCNTDGVGLLNDLIRLGFDPKNKRILLIGAGGAARGVVLPLLSAQPSHLRIINRTTQKALDVVHELAAQPEPLATTTRIDSGDLNHIEGTWDIVINATSSGLHQQSPLHTAPVFSDNGLAYDMVYGNEPTPFLQQCQQAGASHCADGFGMLVGQAAASFFIWHGYEPELEPVLASLR